MRKVQVYKTSASQKKIVDIEVERKTQTRVTLLTLYLHHASCSSFRLLIWLPPSPLSRTFRSPGDVSPSPDEPVRYRDQSIPIPDILGRSTSLFSPISCSPFDIMNA